jgi:hypothetical protein
MNKFYTVLIAVFFIFGISKASILQVCPTSFQNRYFVIYNAFLGKSDQEQAQKAIKVKDQTPTGMPFSSAKAACNTFGLQLANITSEIITDMQALLHSCTPNLGGSWFGWFNGLPNAVCNFLLSSDGAVFNLASICNLGSAVVLCEVPIDPIVTTTTITSITITGGTFTSDVTVYTTTTTVTSFFITHVTSTVISGRSTLTTVTTTSKTCSTITIINTHQCCPRHKFNPDDPKYKNCRPCQFTETSIVIETATASQSITTRTCALTNCPSISTDHSNNEWWEKEEAWNDVNKQLRPVENPKQVSPYQACATSLNNYFLVQLVAKSGLTPKIDGQIACSALGYNFANVTIEAMINLIPLFNACGVTSGVSGATFSSFYDFTPLCANMNIGNSPPGYILSDLTNSPYCTNLQWALCRAGPVAVVSSSIPTGPFTTITLTSTSTDVSTILESVTVIETITALDPLTLSFSSFITTTTTTSTIRTATITSVETLTTSCCCNPIECTSISVCCRHPR